MQTGWRRALVGALVGLAAATPMLAQSAVTPGVAEPAGPGQEGIKVHGRWAIEVRDPDGTLAERREFENSLTTIGAEFLSRFLGRSRTPGRWIVNVGGTPQPCQRIENFQIYAVPCTAVESTAPEAGSQFFPTLQVGLDGPELVLSGSVVPFNSSAINVVSTILQHCEPTVPASSCANSSGGGFSFSIRNLSTPIAVEPGQQILVIVRFSFS